MNPLLKKTKEDRRKTVPQQAFLSAEMSVKYMFALFNINNLSNKGNTLKNQQAVLIKDPEYLHLFMYISVYTDHIVHVQSAAEGTMEE